MRSLLLAALGITASPQPWLSRHLRQMLLSIVPRVFTAPAASPDPA
jgi:hypothetical protein